jgi:hypothetical protein
MGVEVFETSHWVDLNLQRNPQKYVYKIDLIGYPLKEKEAPDQLELDY